MGKLNNYKVSDFLSSLEVEDEEEYLYRRMNIKKPRDYNKKREFRKWDDISVPPPPRHRRGSIYKVIRADKPGRRCVAWSNNGSWLVFVDRTNNTYNNSCVVSAECFIWNRHTHEKLDLPKLPDPYGEERSKFFKCVFYCSEIDREFRVTFCMKIECTLIWSAPGRKTWKITEHFPRSYIIRDLWNFCDVVSTHYRCKNGSIKKLFALTVTGVILTESSLWNVDNIAGPGYNDVRYERRLVNYHDNALFLLQRHPQSAWEVWKMSLSKLIWEMYPPSQQQQEEEEEEGLVFFTSNGYSAAYPRPRRLLKQNCVCYTEEGDHDNLYVFWLADQTLSVFKNRPNSGVPYYYCPPGAIHSETTTPWLSLMEDKNCSTTVDEEANKTTKPQCLDHESTYQKDDICCHELMISKDILSLIAESLDNIADYGNFRGVCKMWMEVARPICWKPDVSSTTTPFKLFPWLMTFENQDNDSLSFLDPTCNMRYYLDNKELSGCKVQYSKDGWLLVTRDTRTIFFYEPFSKTKIDLVDLPEHFTSRDGMSFSSSPTSPDWVILVQRSPRRNIIYSANLMSGNEAWDVVESNIVEYKQNYLCSSSSSLFHDHKFYTLGRDGSLLIIDLRHDAPSQSTFRTGKNVNGSNNEPIVSGSSGYLVSCENEIYRVVIGSLGRFVRVYKLKHDDPVSNHINWDEVKSVNDYAFFVSKTSSLAVPVTENAHKNSINYPVLAENCCLSYKLEVSEFKSFDGNSLCDSGIFGRKELFGDTWIQPKVVCAYRFCGIKDSLQCMCEKGTVSEVGGIEIPCGTLSATSGSNNGT